MGGLPSLPYQGNPYGGTIQSPNVPTLRRPTAPPAMASPYNNLAGLLSGVPGAASGATPMGGYMQAAQSLAGLGGGQVTSPGMVGYVPPWLINSLRQDGTGYRSPQIPSFGGLGMGFGSFRPY